MPQIYDTEPRTRTLSTASSASTSSILEPINADDSIVLSDLVRSGEASRLRRRGAMRIDHSALNNGSGAPPTARNLVLVERPSWDSDFDFDFSAQTDPHLGRPGSLRHTRRRQRSRRYGPYTTGTVGEQEDGEEKIYAIVCGATTMECESDDFEPFKPSVLPLYPTPQAPKSKESSKRSTGCGAVVHLRAVPRPRVGVWSACGAASDTVVALDASYFDTREAAKMVRSKCGCINEGVGCAVCGNPLGTRHIPCKAASESFFCTRNTADKARLRGPEGPQYWHSSSSQAADHTAFTFFPNAVTSSPSYEFPRRRVQSNASEQSLDVSYYVGPASSDEEGDSFPFRDDWSSDGTARGDDVAGSSNVILDRFATSSPTLLSDFEDAPPPPRRTYSRARRPRIYPATTVHEGTVPYSSSPPVSFYQQQVIGAWERERESDRRRTRGGRAFDPDGASEVWGVVDLDGNGAVDMQEPGSPDKANERFLFPER
ncbi:hypothetical protein BDN70DRAFT_933892 [Pholiota conissans]|uniref:Uncharacterized protein n=1 Tax=Pholiota conissans TaxID=109636 RepID=A0A9P6CS63_9AGAR|nr:hypothetical protein BDN70DRAFT_933892 [Pholiota conissans]